MSTKAELASIYPALILVDDDVAVTGEKSNTIFITIVNVDVEPYWPGLFAKALEGINIKKLITSIGSGVGTAPAAADTSVAAAPAEAKKEEKKEEELDQPDDGMGSGLFD